MLTGSDPIDSFHPNRKSASAQPFLIVRAAWIAALGGLTLYCAIVMVLHPPGFIVSDFGAFWCGGRALLLHANPYLNEPLHACEAANSPTFFHLFSNVTVPAPLPPYALALFSLWTLVPFGIARAAWLILLAACVAAEANVIAKLSGRGYVFSLAACGFATAIPALTAGALAPIPIFMLTAAALMMRRQRWAIGAALLGGAMIEPNMVLPACVACFVFSSADAVAVARCGFARSIARSAGCRNTRGSLLFHSCTSRSCALGTLQRESRKASRRSSTISA